MDSREQPQPRPLSLPQQQPNMMVAPTAYPPMLAPATAQFPFNNDAATDTLQPCVASDSSKKKRGRPRKYSPDGNIALGLAPTQTPSPVNSSAAEPPPKKHRGRPPGSGKKLMDTLGIAGTGLTPHVIIAEAGEDVAAKLAAFGEQGPRTVCTFSANGAVRNVTIRAPALPAGTIFYEGQFDILSLKAATLLSENNSSQNRMSTLNVSLAGPDGQVVGGEVVGALTAATTVQIILASFIADGKKSISSNLKSGRASTPSTAFGASPTPTTPTSQGPSTESSEDNENSHFSKGSEGLGGPGSLGGLGGPGSQGSLGGPGSQGSLGGPGSQGGLGGPGLYNDASQPIHNMSMYHLWAGQTQQ